jgi:hypothetical protein
MNRDQVWGTEVFNMGVVVDHSVLAREREAFPCIWTDPDILKYFAVMVEASKCSIDGI